MSVFPFKSEKEQVVLVRILNSIQMALEKQSQHQGSTEQFGENETTEVTENPDIERHIYSHHTIETSSTSQPDKTAMIWRIGLGFLLLFLIIFLLMKILLLR